MAEPLKRLFTVSEYHSMAETGILSEDDRVELIEGEIYRMAPIGSRHAGCVKRLNRILGRRLRDRVLLGIQDPILLDGYSEMEPDVSVLRLRPDHYADSHPTPEEIFFLIEVADSSLGFDRSVKLPAYARNGIPEVWLVDLVQGAVDIHRQPSLSGYRDIRRLRKDDRISPLAFPDLELSASDILG
jgi:Uma2 family endonuclease